MWLNSTLAANWPVRRIKMPCPLSIFDNKEIARRRSGMKGAFR
jgi:hypothetical protein